MTYCNTKPLNLRDELALVYADEQAEKEARIRAERQAELEAYEAMERDLDNREQAIYALCDVYRQNPSQATIQAVLDALRAYDAYRASIGVGQSFWRLTHHCEFATSEISLEFGIWWD